MTAIPLEMIVLDAAIRQHGDQVKAVRVNSVLVGELLTGGEVEKSLHVQATVLLRPTAQWVNVQIHAACRPPPDEEP
jgi:hypothetical protein